MNDWRYKLQISMVFEGSLECQHFLQHVSWAYLGSGVDGELQLGLLAVVHRQTLHQQGGEAGAGAATEGVEDEEALQTGALVSQLADPVEDEVDDLLADGVVAAGVVVGGVLLAGDELLGVEELAVGAGADLVCNHHQRPFNKLFKA